ncbi:MAG: hypothetical protein QFX32_05320 [Methanolinea sp.]|nr:hypothetical protein [Methanolinea sp.]
MENDGAHDFTELTCTNLMITLKILLGKLREGEAVTFYATREQVDNTCSPFSRQGYKVSWDEIAENRFLVKMGK